MRKRILSALIVVTLIMSSVSGMTVTASAAADVGTIVTLDPSEASPFNNGEFEGWGTSLCWWANRMGYSPELTRQAADAFFSEDGLGLDIARYNLGGGDDPTHNHITRSDSKVPGVWKTFELTNDGKDVNITYDITKDQNQLNMAKAAKAANPDLYFEGFSNSPPYFMTVTGCTSGGDPADSDNLKADMYDDFGRFITDATKLFKAEGIEFKSYSPMNEPDTNYWGVNSEKQEGCHYSPGESQSKAIIETRKALDAAGLNDVLVAGMDETDINKSVANYPKLSAEAKTALGRIDTHTYNGNQRTQLKKVAVDVGKDLWMSEVDGGWDGFGLADRIITDLNGMQASAWVLWDIVDSHKDSNFTKPDGSKGEANTSLNITGAMWGVGMADHDAKKLELANKYYFFGQFTKYINPGDTIIASSDNTLAAYNKKTGDIKIVALNSSSSDKKYTFDLGAFLNVGSTVEEIRTNNLTGDNAEHWKSITGEATLENKKISTTLKAGTLTTYIVKGGAGTATNYGSIKGGSNMLENNSQIQLSFETNVESEQSVQWSVSDENIASITQEGVLTIKNIGDMTVYAKLTDDYIFSRTFDIPFKGEIKGVGTTLRQGMKAQLSLEANIEGEDSWSSSNSSIAEITSNGLLIAKEPGEVKITVQRGGYTVEKIITVSLYTLTGTASWGNDSNRPSDDADYTKVADKDLTTYFDGTTGGWVQYDYGTPFKVSKIKLAARSGNGMPERTVGGTVQGSHDGITWNDMYKITSAISANKYTEIEAGNLTNNESYRYYRYTNESNMANIAEFLIEGEAADDVSQTAPKVTDLEEFTDDFDGSSNIFGAPSGTLEADGKQVFASSLSRFGNVFVPVKDTAAKALPEAKALTKKDKFRLSFTMFSGWENNGKENTFAVKDKDGKELVAIKMTGGGYNFNEIRIGGKNVLASPTTSQCRSNPGSGSKAGANGWNESGQAYVNAVGYNKTVEIIIDGTGSVSVSATGGLEDTKVSGTISSDNITINSIELSGSYNSSRNRVVSYDNFDGDIITYAEELKPSETPAPTEPPVVPENGELINLNFDKGDLTSTSSYGKATGSPKFAEVDGKKCMQFDGTNATAVKLTDANGNGLLTGQKNITISFKIKPTVTTTSWWFYAAPNDNSQTVNNEKYIGAFTKNGVLEVERYNNSGSRSTAATGAYKTNEWNDVIISVNDTFTTVYINGQQVSNVASAVDISSMLGAASVAYIGKANWGSGEYAAGYIDDFVIYNYAMPYLNVERDGKKISYSTGYSSAMPFDMYIALYNQDNVLKGMLKNNENGSFSVTDDENYTVTQYLWKGMVPMTNPVRKTASDGAYLFAHFVGTESEAKSEQIYFSVSIDGTTWKTLNGGEPVLTSTVGEQGVRDPYILRGEDGKFFIIATDLSIYNRRDDENRWSTCQTAGSKSIVVWESSDLVNWSDASLVKVTKDNAGCTWAPEAVYDAEKGKYMVFWASKTADDNYATQRMYRSYTEDFKTFSEPEIFIDGGTISNIDTTITSHNGVYYRFTKNESNSSVNMMKSTSLDGPWTDVETYTLGTMTGYEGPTIYKLNGEDKWCLLLDYYSKSQGYKPFVTDNISKGTFTAASDFNFDTIYRHGTVMPITKAEYDKLVEKYK